MATDYDNFGGKDFFTSLVKDFYQEIINDPILKPMYPEDDLDGAIERLTLFLMQYWGGPSTYSELRGHPRLRMRHAAFPIDFAARDSWLKNMTVALDKQQELNYGTIYKWLQIPWLTLELMESFKEINYFFCGSHR
jgi:hemoglobin